MTREEEIEQAALAEYGCPCNALSHFVKGAEWADKHPQSGSSEIPRNRSGKTTSSEEKETLKRE